MIHHFDYNSFLKNYPNPYRQVHVSSPNFTEFRFWPALPRTPLGEFTTLFHIP